MKPFNFKQFLMTVGTILLMMVMTQVITFLISIFIPQMGEFTASVPLLILILIWICFSAGVFLVGWLAIRRRWLPGALLLQWRLPGTIAGVLLPLLVGWLTPAGIIQGSPFFFIAIVTGILGFFLPGWLSCR